VGVVLNWGYAKLGAAVLGVLGENEKSVSRGQKGERPNRIWEKDKRRINGKKRNAGSPNSISPVETTKTKGNLKILGAKGENRGAGM